MSLGAGNLGVEFDPATGDAEERSLADDEVQLVGDRDAGGLLHGAGRK